MKKTKRASKVAIDRRKAAEAILLVDGTDIEITSYEENVKGGWMEIFLMSTDACCPNKLTLDQLKRLAVVFGTETISVTSWSEWSGDCAKCGELEHHMSIVAGDVVHNLN